MVEVVVVSAKVAVHGSGSHSARAAAESQGKQ